MISRYLFLLVALLLAFQATGTLAAPPEAPLPPELSPALDHLLAQAGPGRGEDFNPELILPLLEFVMKAGNGPLFYEETARQHITSAFHPFALKSDLARLLRYAYNSAIPPQVITPSSVRLGRWTEVEGMQQPLPPLWQRLSSLHDPVMVRGEEYEEITPNLATGTYFAYHLHRTLILFHWRGRPVLINISRQKDRSSVGKKGAVLGPDGDWNYLYSGEKGLALSGLGWIDSYMYDSYSIGIFCETGGGRPELRGGVFKWLSAGWRGLNMVGRHHIHEGLVRYARDLKAVLENPRLPPADELAETFSRLQRRPTPELAAHLRRYLEALERRYGRDRVLARAGLDRRLRSGDYLAQLTRPELEAALALELMKGLLGQPGADAKLLQAIRP